MNSTCYLAKYHIKSLVSYSTCHSAMLMCFKVKLFNLTQLWAYPKGTYVAAEEAAASRLEDTYNSLLHCGTVRKLPSNTATVVAAHARARMQNE